ncbi:MAG: hypothetical protein QOE14_1930 [Humisphaera sp.]|nr:hypothetical protein [Humisphaera sp.]
MDTALPTTFKKSPELTSSPLQRVLYANGLSIVLLFTFIVLLAAQSFTGWKVFNQEQKEHGEAAITFGQYFATGHFVEATAENWESEFLQMAAFVWLAVHLRQKGSPESKPLEGDEEVDRDPDPNRPGAPWPVRRGGIWLMLYSHSLTWAFLLMFFISFLFHAAGGAREYSQNQIAHGESGVTILQFMRTAEFWFQSMQNWQSEFLAIAAMVLLSVWLRQKGSPESKPVDAAHADNE